MKNGNEFSFSDRLRRLYDAHYETPNFTDTWGWSQRVAKDLLSHKGVADTGLLLEWSADTYGKKRHDQPSYISSTLRNHLKYKSAADCSGRWLSIYCAFFRCSAAYLFGEIDGFTPEETDIQANTGLDAKAIRTLMNYRISGLIENDNTIGAVLSFLLRPDHCKRNSGGLLHLVAAYLTGDFSVSGMDESINPADYIHTSGKNGSGFEIPTSEVVRAALPNMILQRLYEYRTEMERRAKK